VDANKILEAALQASWQASIGIVVLLAMRALAGRYLSGRWLYSLWVVLMVRLLIPGSLLPVLPASVPKVIALGDTGELAAFPLMGAPIGKVELTRTTGGEQAAAAKPNPQRRPVAIDWGMALIVTWATGAGALALYLVCASIWLHRRINKERRPTPEHVLKWWDECLTRIPARNLRLVTSEAVKAPLLFGLVRPKLVLPYRQLDGLSRVDWEHIFVHELAHHRRRDSWSNLVPLAALCVHWYNPLVWLCQRAIRAAENSRRTSM